MIDINAEMPCKRDGELEKSKIQYIAPESASQEIEFKSTGRGRAYVAIITLCYDRLTKKADVASRKYTLRNKNLSYTPKRGAMLLGSAQIDWSGFIEDGPYLICENPDFYIALENNSPIEFEGVSEESP